MNTLLKATSVCACVSACVVLRQREKNTERSQNSLFTDKAVLIIIKILIL